MATIVWTDPQGVERRSHTLDPVGTRREIEQQHGGQIVDVEQPVETSSRKTYHRDPSGRVVGVTEVSTEIRDEPKPTPVPVVEPEEERTPSTPRFCIGSICESEAYREHEAGRRGEFVPGTPDISPPTSGPSVYERPGITATPSQIRRLPTPRKPTAEQVRTVSISRAEREAGERIEQERIGFEEVEQPRAQDITQQKYDELIGGKAVELGMTWDTGQGAWIGSESQIESFHEYEPEARTQAMTFGTEYYQTQWEQFDIGERAERITSEEFAEEGFVLVEKDDGTFNVVPAAELERQRRVSGEKERIRARMTGTPEERVSQLALFVSSAFIKPFSETGLLGVTGEAIFGGEDKGEVILGKLAREAEEFRGLTAPELFGKSFMDPEGFGFTGVLAAVTMGAGTLLAGLKGTGGVILQKGIPTVARGALVTMVGAELGITAAAEGKEEAAKLAFRRFGQIAAFEMFGALATGRPILPKLQREIVFEAKTGIVTQQRYFDVLGKQVRIPGIKQAQILTPTRPDTFRVLGIPGAMAFGTGPSFKMTVPTAPVKEPFVGGLSAKASVTPVAVSKFGDLTFVDTGVVRPTTGIPMPGVYTGRQPVLRGIRSLIEQPKPGKLVIAEPELEFGAITESMEKNLKFIAKGKEWQPITGIAEPAIRDITGRVKPYIAPEEKKIVSREPFRVKPKPDVVTKLDVSPKGIISIEKYGRKLIDVGKVKGIVGEPLPGMYTGRQPVLRGPRPLVEVKRKPGALIKIEEIFPLLPKLESGLAREFEGLVKVKPVVSKKPKVFRLKDIIKPEEDDLISKTISGTRQKTIQVLEKPKVITKQELKLKSLTKTKDIAVDKLKMKSLVVSEKQYLESMTQMKQPIMLQDRKLSVGLLLAQDMRRKQIKKSETSIMLDMARTGDTIQRRVTKIAIVPIQTTAQMEDTSFKFRTILTTVFPVVKPPFVEPPFIKPPDTKPPEEEIIEPTKFKTLPFELDLVKGISLTPQSYDVFTYKTQFQNGKRIRGRVLKKINKRPLRRLDALALGSDIVDNSAKRTLILKPAEGKPTKLKRKVPGWSGQMFEYNRKGDNIFVEKNINAIDSAGEIREITMKGIAARRQGKGKKGMRDLSNIGVKMDREMNRLGRRLI